MGYRVGGDIGPLLTASHASLRDDFQVSAPELDLAVDTRHQDQAANSPLFLPLAARLTPAATAAIEAGHPLRPGKWNKHVELPTSNLISMVQDISSAINIRIQKRENPPSRTCRSKADMIKRSLAQSELRRHDLLSVEQFHRLLCCLNPDARPEGHEGCGFDIYALLPAANLFSLLTPRDGARPTNGSRRAKPCEIVILCEIPNVYLQWWKRNSGELAKDAC